MHHYFHIEGKTDLAVEREQAQSRLKAGNKYGAPTESVIHLHRAIAPCRGHEHEFYPLGDDQDLPKRFWEAVGEVEELEMAQ